MKARCHDLHHGAHIPLLDAPDPATLQATRVRQGAMFAAAMAFSMGEAEGIRHRLRPSTSFFRAPGRMNVFAAPFPGDPRLQA
jgi:hypothetical protein